MTRTDIHRPSAPEFDPEAYDLFGVYDLSPDKDWPDDRVQVVSSLVDEGWSFAGAPHGSFQCSHCGTRIRYAALMGHRDTKTLLYVGETCLDNRFSLTKSEFAALRKEAALNAERRNLRAAREAFLVDHPLLVWASYANNIAEAGAEYVWETYSRDGSVYAEESYATREDAIAATGWEWPWETTKRGTAWIEKTRQGKNVSTLDDMWGRFLRYGDMSDKAYAFMTKVLDWMSEADERLQQREAQHTALVDAGVKVPTGRVVIEGTVLSTKSVEQQAGPYGTQWVTKMLVQADEGWKVWSTLPSSLPASTDKGDRIRFTATVTASDDDPTFGFAKRPAKAEVLS